MVDTPAACPLVLRFFLSSLSLFHDGRDIQEYALKDNNSVKSWGEMGFRIRQINLSSPNETDIIILYITVIIMAADFNHILIPYMFLNQKLVGLVGQMCLLNVK